MCLNKCIQLCSYSFKNLGTIVMVSNTIICIFNILFCTRLELTQISHLKFIYAVVVSSTNTNS